MKLQTERIGLIGDVNKVYPLQGDWGALRDRFEQWYQEHLLGPEGLPVIQGGATPLTSLRTRWDREAVVSATGESHEVDFNIAFGQAIEISAVDCRLLIGAVTATISAMEVLVDLDGPALANNALGTQALFELREVLSSVIANFGLGADVLTSGGAKSEDLQHYIFTEPILTARNIGVGYLSVGASGEGLVGIQHKLVEVSRDEQLLLFALGRA